MESRRLHGPQPDTQIALGYSASELVSFTYSVSPPNLLNVYNNMLTFGLFCNLVDGYLEIGKIIYYVRVGVPTELGNWTFRSHVVCLVECPGSDADHRSRAPIQSGDLQEQGVKDRKLNQEAPLKELHVKILSRNWCYRSYFD